MDLPVNKIVELVIFAIVLVSIVLLLIGNVTSSGEQITLANDIRQCCRVYKDNGCHTYNIQNTQGIFCPNGELLTALALKAGYNETTLNITCGCPV